MLKIENVVLPSAEQLRAIILGARNAMNSWDRSDSFICKEKGPMTLDEIDAECGKCPKGISDCDILDGEPHFIIGSNDHQLMMQLRNAGTDHRKFMRMIIVYLNITAPLYWWKEMDTYAVGKVQNSCSTMHKIHAKEFTLEDFSCEKLYDPIGDLRPIVDRLNIYRERYLETKDKNDWWQMIQLLPTSYNQKRTVMLNYEVLANIYKSRRNHKLDCWHTLCDWISELPYSELITGEEYDVK